MKAKTMRRSLFMSVISLLLCMSMLVGTTFAWFTDSVTSANNIIKSGNLDVELYYQVEGQNDWAKVTADTSVFMKDALWEPGHTEVVKLKVVNEGSLALKYQLGVNIASETGSVNALGADFKLSDHIKFGIVEGDKAYTRDQAVAAVDASANNLNQVYNSSVTALLPKTDDTTAEDVYTDIITMVVYMPTTVGNEANHAKGENQPIINLGINLFATQVENEFDSFGNEYDAGAWDFWSGTAPTEKPESLVVDTTAKVISINDADGLAYLNTLLNDGNFADNYGSKWQYTVELNADIDLLNKPWTPINLSNVISFNGNGHTIKNLNIAANSNNVGLFGSISCNDLGDIIIENFTIDGATVSGKEYVGVVAGVGTGKMRNITVVDATVNGTKYVGGLAGKGTNLDNCSVQNSTVTSTGKTVGGLVGYAIYDSNTNDSGTEINNLVENVTVTGTYNVGGMFGQAQYVLVENNTVKNVTVISTKELPADASSNEVRTAEVAARCDFERTVIRNNTAENVTCEEAVMIYGLKLTLNDNVENYGTITVSDKEGLLNLAKLAEDWEELFTDGQGNYLDPRYYYSWTWDIVLTTDIDFGGAQIQPIDLGKKLVFDGQGHTIKNAVIVTDATTQNNAGLFSARDCGVKNLKLDNIKVTGSNVGDSCVGILSGICNKAIDNITITNSSAYGGKYTGGVVGYGYTTITNCTVENVTVKGGYKLGGIIGYICAESVDGHNVIGNTLTDCTVDGIGDGIFAGGKTQYIVGKVVGNYNCNGNCKSNTITNMTTSATENIGKIEAGKTVNQ